MPFHRHFQVVVAISCSAVDVIVHVAGLPLRLSPPPALRHQGFCIISNMFFIFFSSDPISVLSLLLYLGSFYGVRW